MNLLDTYRNKIAVITAATVVLAASTVLYHSIQTNMASTHYLFDLSQVNWSGPTLSKAHSWPPCSVPTNCSQSETSSWRQSDLIVMAERAIADGDYLKAGQNYEAAGVFDILAESSDAAAQYGLTAAERMDVSESLLALAESQLRVWNSAEIATATQTVRSIAAGDADLIARSFDLQARSDALNGSQQLAFEHIRFSFGC